MVLKSYYQLQGRREYMEDYLNYVRLPKNNIEIALLCDGHGGQKVAELTSKFLPYKLIESLKEKDLCNIEIALIIRQTIRDWGNKMKTYLSGSTLTGLIIIKEYVFIINIGDSRTCFEKKKKSNIYFLEPQFKNLKKIEVKKFTNDKTFFCTKDHNNFNFFERNRVNNVSGSFILNDRLNGILSVTRSFGDKDVGKGLTYEPDIYWIKEKDIINEILLYSDGLYEIYDKKKLLYKGAEKYGIKKLVKEIYKMGSEDNISGMTLKLNNQNHLK